jgi:hypothetical protein
MNDKLIVKWMLMLAVDATMMLTAYFIYPYHSFYIEHPERLAAILFVGWIWIRFTERGINWGLNIVEGGK